jgi:hypothetical protein
MHFFVTVTNLTPQERMNFENLLFFSRSFLKIQEPITIVVPFPVLVVFGSHFCAVLAYSNFHFNIILTFILAFTPGFLQWFRPWDIQKKSARNSLF